MLQFLPFDLTLLFAGITAVFCIFALRRERRLPSGSLAVFAIFVAMAAGLHWPADLAAYSVQKELRLYSLTALSAAAPLLLLQGKEERRAFILAAALLGLAMAAVAAIEIAGAGNTVRLRVFNTNPILLARLGGFVVLVLTLLCWQRGLGGWLLLPLTVMAMLALLASGSRGPLVALVATLAITLPLCIWVERRPPGYRGTVLASITLVSFGVLYVHSASAQIAERFQRLLTGEWGDTEVSRWAVWRQTANLISEHPWGVGWGRLETWIQVYNDSLVLRHPHNIFLEIAAEAGWPAAVIFTAVISCALWLALRRFVEAAKLAENRIPFDELIVVAVPLYWLGCALFSGDVNDNRPFWAVFGMLLAALTVKSNFGSAGQGGRRILHLSSAHRVSDGRIARKEAVALRAAGYDVTVLGLRRAEGTVLPDGLRFVEYGEPASRARRFLLRLPWLLGYCLRNRYAAYHLHDPDLILVGFILKIAGRRVVYDVHESYPMVVLDRHWIPRALRPALSYAWHKMEAAFVACADLTIAAHEPVARQFGSGRVVTVRNYPIVGDLVVTQQLPMAHRPRQVVYHGDLTEQRGLWTMIEAIGKVPASEGVELRLAGSLSTRLAKGCAALPGMQRTSYLGWLDKRDLAEELSRARAGLVLLHPTHNYRVICPNKLFEYMAAGLPVIASDFPHWREVVGAIGCGLLVDPLDSSAIAEAILYLLANPQEAEAMGEQGRRAVQERYNWRTEGNRLVDAYASLFSEGREASTLTVA